MIAMRHKKLVLGFSTIPMDYNGSCTTNSPLFVLYFTYFILVGNQFVLVALFTSYIPTMGSTSKLPYGYPETAMEKVHGSPAPTKGWAVDGKLRFNLE